MASDTRITLSNSVRIPRRNAVQENPEVEEAAFVSNVPEATEPTSEYVKETPTGVVPKSTGDVQRENYVPPEEVSLRESFVAGMWGMGRDIKDSYVDSKEYEYDPHFNPATYIATASERMGTFSPEEVRKLSTSKNHAHFVANLEKIAQSQQRAYEQSVNPLVGGLGSLVDVDLPIAFVPFLGAGAKAGRAAQVASRVAAAGVGYAATAGVQGLQGDTTLRTADQQEMDRYIIGLARLVAPALRSSQVAQATVAARTSTATTKPTAPKFSLAPTPKLGTAVPPPSTYSLAPPKVPVAPVKQSQAASTGVARNLAPQPHTIPMVKPVAVVRAEAIADAGRAGLTDAEIAALPKQVRGAARQKRKVIRDDALKAAKALPKNEAAARDAAITAASTVGRTDAEIAALPKSTRGTARQARAAQRATALAKAKAMPTSAPVPPKYTQAMANAPTQPVAAPVAAPTFKPANIAPKANPQNSVPSFTSQTFKPVKGGGVQVVNPIPAQAAAGSTAAQTLAQNITADLNAPRPTGTPNQQIAGNKYVAMMQSAADYLLYLTKGDTNSLVNKLLSNPSRGAGDDVVSRQVVYDNTYTHMLLPFHDKMKDAVAETGMRNTPVTRFNGQYGQRIAEVSNDFQEYMQRLDSRVLAYEKANGVVPSDDIIKSWITLYTDKPKMRELMETWVDSGFAVRVYDDAVSSGAYTQTVTNAAGVQVVEDVLTNVVRRPTYLNLRQDFEKMFETVKSGKATWDEIYDYVGGQIARMYPELINPTHMGKQYKLTERQAGQHFVQTQKANSRDLTQIAATGMTQEQVINLLTKSGSFSNKEAMAIAGNIHKQIHAKGASTPKNFRRRIEWDWNLTVRTQSGETLGMRDIVSNDVLGNIEDYRRGMAHRLGLADYGIKSEAELDNVLQAVMDDLPADVAVADAKVFLRNVKDSLAGRAIENNPEPKGIRIAKSVAGLFVLAQSGLYSLQEVVTQMQKLGVLHTLQNYKQGMKAMFGTLRKFNGAEAQELTDILTGRLLATGAHKNFTKRYMDNFTVSSGFEEAASYYGQSTKFLNLSESVRRFQVGTLASIYTNNLKKAMAGNKQAIDFMHTELRLNDDLIQGIEREYAKHGTDIDSWAHDVRLAYEQKLFHSADNLAHTIHTGEIPAFMEHSAVGRIIFPFMTFAFAMTNKVMRRTIERDGYAGLAMLAAVQIPTGMLIAAASNLRKGEDWDKDLELVTARSLSFVGMLNFPFEMILAGEVSDMGMSPAIPFVKGSQFLGEVKDGFTGEGTTARDLLSKSPLNAAAFLGILAAVTDDMIIDE